MSGALDERMGTLRPSISLLPSQKMISEIFPTSLLGNLLFFSILTFVTWEMASNYTLLCIFLQLLIQSNQSQPLKAIMCALLSGQVDRELHFSSRFVLLQPSTETPLV